MNSRDLVSRTIRFQNPERLPYDFPEKYGSDFHWIGMSPSPDDRPRNGGYDEWGALWKTFGFSQLGEVKDFPLKEWGGFEKLVIPDIQAAHRWQGLEAVRERAGDKFVLASGISIYERVHFIRGLENTWMDIYQAPEQLGRLIDVLVEMNLTAIQKYASVGADGYIFCDDWGLQNRLMIAPKAWRSIWKPRYERIFQAAHAAGMFTFLHSCGYIVDILDDLIEIGLDVIHMDQQENMGLILLGDRFGGRLTFFSPVDIQFTLARGDVEEIRAYARDMVRLLGRPNGGFIPRWYSDPKGAGHTPEAVEAMCEAFLSVGGYEK
jgi:uroporphyrinogen decarboxylase